MSKNENPIEPELESGAFTFYNNRISVRRDFRITTHNKKKLEEEPYKKSDVLYMALREFYSSDYFLTKEGVSILAKKIDHKNAPRANLWVDYKQDIWIKELKKRGVSRQTVMNFALEQYFEKRRDNV